MRILLGTDPVKLPGNRSRPVIQNLGPGSVYLDTDGDVDSSSGFVIAPGAVYEFPAASSRSRGIFVVSDTADTDVRVVTV